MKTSAVSCIDSTSPAPVLTKTHSHHAAFEKHILPAVKSHALITFRRLPACEREEAIQAAVCLAFAAYRQLLDQGKKDRIFPTALATLACQQVQDGRNLGSRRRRNEALSRLAQKRRGFSVVGISNHEELPKEVAERLGEHDRCPVPDQAAFRIDFPAWMATLGERLRAVTNDLLLGSTTGEVARKYELSAGRVSQLRRKLADSWDEFHAGVAAAAA